MNYCSRRVLCVVCCVLDSDEMKKRMYSCIVVVGGALMFPGAQSWLQYLVWTHMSPHMRLALETMDVITKPKVSHDHRRSQGTQVHPQSDGKKFFLGIFVGMRQNGTEFGEVHPRS